MDQPQKSQKELTQRRLRVPVRDIVVPTRHPLSRSSDASVSVPPKATNPVIDAIVPRAVPTKNIPQQAWVPSGAHLQSDRLRRELTKTSRRLHIYTSRTEAGASHLSQSTKKTPRTPRIAGRMMSSKVFRYGAALCIVCAVSYIGVDVWRTNTQLKQDLTSTVSALGSPNAASRQTNEGRDESLVSVSAVDSYQVAPSLPRVLTIANAKVHARVLSMDVNPDNSVQAPININDAGWYTGSAKPGEPGAALIDGHASGATRQGLFGYLDTLKLGDTVEVERGDGVKFIYEVVHTETVKREDVDMAKLLMPYGGAPQGLNLITCTGTYIRNEKTYDSRAIVYTKLVKQVTKQ